MINRVICLLNLLVQFPHVLYHAIKLSALEHDFVQYFFSDYIDKFLFFWDLCIALVWYCYIFLDRMTLKFINIGYEACYD